MKHVIRITRVKPASAAAATTGNPISDIIVGLLNALTFGLFDPSGPGGKNSQTSNSQT